MASKHSLWVHIRELHLDKKLLCGVCGESCKSNAQLKRHQRFKHQQLLKCNECGKEFKKLSDLNAHVNIVHLGSTESTCHSCDKVFWNKKALRTHVLTIHEKLKPFFCVQVNCPYKCARFDNLNVHRSKMHQLPRMGRKEYRELIENKKHPNCEELDMSLLALL